jgi:2-amino-4-hydroxy-6-hydroxymethyldihydropteridine diphosphokinase
MQSSNRIPKESKLARVFLGLGSNMGDREHNLQTALQALSQKIELVKVSSLYDTAPVGNTLQERFLNIACAAATELPPIALLAFIKEIEHKLGRRTGPVNSPRPIDIDILFYGDLIIDTPGLVIPHPRLTERAFVLAPLNEIAPRFMHPVTKQTISRLYKTLKIIPGDAVKLQNIRGVLCTK